MTVNATLKMTWKGEVMASFIVGLYHSICLGEIKKLW